MFKGKNLIINDFTVGGVKNPRLCMRGKYINEVDLKLIVDNKEVILNSSVILGREYVFNRVIKGNNEQFEFFADLPFKCRKLNLYECKKSKKVLIITKNISFMYRVLEKIKFESGLFFRKISRLPKVILRTLKLSWKRHYFLIPFRLIKKYFKSFQNNLTDNNLNAIFYDPLNQNDYLKWLDLKEKKLSYESFSYHPLISIIIPVYNVSSELLSACIDSVLNQTYSNLEVCLADDNSTKSETRDTLKAYTKKDKRIKVIFREKNGHISECSNSALSLATGEFVGLLDNDDVLDKNALYEVVKALNKNRKLDLLYSDEDKIHPNGKFYYPHFKPNWSPDTLLSINYICHFTVLRKKIVDEIGGFRSKYDGAQDYDLFLRVTEKTQNIYHIPKILYHWRMIEGSTASSANEKDYAYLNGKLALEDALKRRKIDGIVNLIEEFKMYEIQYKYKKEPSISIIIPTKDKSDVLDKCLTSIYEKTEYNNYEIIVVDNGSVEQKTKELFQKYKFKHNNFKVLRLDCEFNYSYLNNEAVKNASGEYVLLLNNDVEVISKEWLNKMVGYAIQKHVGCVGAKLLYPNKTLQHCGVVIGVGGIASHTDLGTSYNQSGYFGRLVAVYDWSAVTAACLMISKKKFLEVGGLDEKLKVAYNDVDLNVKVLKKGYYNIVIPSVMLFHYESLSRGSDLDGERRKRFISEINYMADKWKKEIIYDKYYNDNFSYSYPFRLDKSKSK